MAITPRENETFYREVDEELRKEQAAKWFKRYGVAAIAAVLLLLAGIAGFLWWQHSQREQAAQHGELFSKALEEAGANQKTQAIAKLDTLVKEGGTGYQAAALLTKASLAAQDSVVAARANPIPGTAPTPAREDAAKRNEAIGLFRQVAENGDFPEPYRNVALIRQTTLEFDTLQPAQVIQRLQPLAQPGNPWFGSAGEMVALAHLKAGRPQQAGPLFAAIAKDQNLPESMRSRARQMAGALGFDAVTDAPAGAAKE